MACWQWKVPCFPVNPESKIDFLSNNHRNQNRLERKRLTFATTIPTLSHDLNPHLHLRLLPLFHSPPSFPSLPFKLTLADDFRVGVDHKIGPSFSVGGRMTQRWRHETGSWRRPRHQLTPEVDQRGSRRRHSYAGFSFNSVTLLFPLSLEANDLSKIDYDLPRKVKKR